jgi:hypothetical protein
MSTMPPVRKENSHRVVPVTEMFAHIGKQKRLYRAMADSVSLNTFSGAGLLCARDQAAATGSGSLGKVPAAGIKCSRLCAGRDPVVAAAMVD